MGLTRNKEGVPPYLPGKQEVYRRLEEMRTWFAVQDQEHRKRADSLRAAEIKAVLYELAETLARYADEIANEAEKERTSREAYILLWDYSQKLCDVVPHLSDTVAGRGEWAKK